jgi:hypothetical protein
MSWESHRQRRVSLSSTEAEYYAASEAATETLWFRKLLHEISVLQSTNTMFEDNKSTIVLANNPVAENMKKQIDIQTSKNIGDLFTKVMAAPQFHYLSNMFMTKVRSVQPQGVQNESNMSESPERL